MRTSRRLTPEKYLTPEEQVELEVLLDKYGSTDLRNTTMLLLSLKTGARPREVLNLVWEDVDLKYGNIFLRTLKRGHGRVVPIKKNLVQRLESMGPGSGMVFPLSYSMFYLIWKEYRPCKKKLHALRHTFAVNAYRKSKNNVKLVQQALGHKYLATTGIYLDFQITDKELRQAID